MVELLLPGHHASELMLAMLLGVMGALVAQYIGRVMGWYGAAEPARVPGRQGWGNCRAGALRGALSARPSRASALSKLVRLFGEAADCAEGDYVGEKRCSEDPIVAFHSRQNSPAKHESDNQIGKDR